MKLSAAQICSIINAELMGDPDVVISGISSFDDAGVSDITFAADVKFLNDIQKTKAGAVIVPKEFNVDPSWCKTTCFFKVDAPKRAFFDLVAKMHPATTKTSGTHPSALIGENVSIGEGCIIEGNVCIGDGSIIGESVHLMPGVFVGEGTSIGSRTTIKPNVTILERSVIGSDVLIHSGSVIGSDGFGFTQSTDTHEKIIHTGVVEIGDQVEIGACNTIDRGTLGKTVIGNGVKTDNLVHIAHNVKIGDNTLIVAQAGIAGSTRVGNNVIIAGKAGISGHLTIGDQAIVGPYTGVHSNVSEKQIVSGIPQLPHSRWRKVVSIIARLPELRKSLLSHEKRLSELENNCKSAEQE